MGQVPLSIRVLILSYDLAGTTEEIKFVSWFKIAFLMPVADDILSTFFDEWYPTFSRCIVYGFIEDPIFLRAFIYSIAKILFGLFITSSSIGKIVLSAFARATGKTRPCDK